MRQIFTPGRIEEIARSYGVTKTEVIWIIEGVSGRPFYHLLLDGHLPTNLEERIYEILSRRKEGVPLPYLGFPVSFMGLEIDVPEGVFIPRPETEVLVEKVFDLFPDRGKPLYFVDVGIGSGAIALAILREYRNAVGIGIDISRKALVAASLNARRLSIDRLHLILGDCLDAIRNSPGGFDLIVSNPPYVSIDEYEGLQKEVKMEPRRALIGGRDGVLYHRKILKEASRLLAPKGVVVMEMAPHQEEMVLELARSLSFSAETFKDLEGRVRGVVAFRRRDSL